MKKTIVEMSDDAGEQMVNKVKESPFYSIQLDECTDTSSQPQLSVFIRYVSNDEGLEGLLSCKALQLYAKGENIF